MVACTFKGWKTEIVLGRLRGDAFERNAEIIRAFGKGQELWERWEPTADELIN